MTAREFITKWGFQIETDKLKRLENQLQGIKSRMDAFTGAKVAQALFHMAEEFSKVGEQIQIAAGAAGLAVEEFQQLAYAGKQNNIEMGEMQSGLARLSRSLYSARQGSEQFATAFRELGINNQQLMGFKNTKDALFAISDRLKSISDPIKRAALAQQLLGRGSQNMISMLTKGSGAMKALGKEAVELGIILSHDQVDALDRLENTLQKLWSFLKGIGARISADVAPVFEHLINQALEFYQANRKIIEENLRDWLMNFAYALGFVWQAFVRLTEVVLRFAKALGIENKLLTIVATVAGLASAILAVSTAVGLLSPALQGLLTIFKVLRVVGLAAISPIALEIAGITLALTALYDLYQYFAGGKMITPQLWKMGKDALGFGSNGVPEGGGFAGLDEMRKSSPQDGGAGNQNNNYSVNAPISIQVPPGTDPSQVGKSVQDGVTQHLERVMRETQRSFTRTRAY